MAVDLPREVKPGLHAPRILCPLVRTSATGLAILLLLPLLDVDAEEVAGGVRVENLIDRRDDFLSLAEAGTRSAQALAEIGEFAKSSLQPSRASRGVRFRLAATVKPQQPIAFLADLLNRCSVSASG